MINHFPSYKAAEAHVVAKGFTQKGSIWVSRDGWVDARIITDPHRGVYIHFREVVAS